MLGLAVGALILAVPYRRHLPSGAADSDRAACCCCSSRSSSRAHFFEDGASFPRPDERRLENAHFSVYGFIPHVLRTRSALRARPEHLLGLLRVRHRQEELGAALVLRRPDRRDGRRRRRLLFALFIVWVFRRLGAARALGRRLAGPATRSRPRAPARLGLHGRTRRDDRRQRLLPDNAVLLLLRVHGLAVAVPVVFAPPPRMRVARPDDVVPALGGRRRRGVRRRGGRGTAERGVDVTVVSPADSGTSASRTAAASYRTSVRGRELVAALPLFLAAYARAARRASRDADLVHAHWIPSAIAARRNRKAVRVAGVGHRRRAGTACAGFARPLLRGAHTVIAASSFLAEEARKLGASGSRWCRRGSSSPGEVGEPAEPAARPLRRPAERGEGDPRVRRGDRGLAARDRRRRPAARPGAGGGRLRRPGAARCLLRARCGRLRPFAA